MRERREQFERLVDEGRRLRALIRDEKEEVERREGMDSDAEDGEAAPTPGNSNATPRPDNVAVSSNKGDAGNATPRPGNSRDERTPGPDSPGRGPLVVGGESMSSRFGINVPHSRSVSVALSITAGSQGNGDDAEMSESAMQQRQSQDGDTPMAEESRSAPHITVEAPTGDGDDKMDTT